MKASKNKDNVQNNWANHGFGSNPQKSWEGGKQGMKPAPVVGSQSSSTVGGSGNSGSSTSLGNASRVSTKPNKQGSSWQSPSAVGNQSGRKAGESPVGEPSGVMGASKKGGNDLTANQPEKQSWHSAEGGSGKAGSNKGPNASSTTSRSNAKSQSRTGK